MATEMKTKTRRVVRRFNGMPTEDGAGVKLTRMIGTHELPDLDPFLMLDVIRSDDPKGYIAGFPEHPHRGFETISYMIRGSMQHRDNHGGEGLVTDGGVQWMKAARGVVHSEIPAQSGGELFGYQLWLNLPADEKMTDPWYRDIPASEIPNLDLGDDAKAKLIAGTWNGQRGPGPERKTEPFIADVFIPAYGQADIPVPEGHQAFVYVFEGGVSFGEGQSVRAGELAVLSNGESVHVSGLAQGGRLLIIAGKPIREPIAKYGPFVMNTADQIHQAIADFRAGKF